MSPPQPARKRGPKPGTGGRPRNASPTVKLSVQVSAAARDNIFKEAARRGMKAGAWLTQQHGAYVIPTAKREAELSEALREALATPRTTPAKPR